MQLPRYYEYKASVVISFQFSAFVSLMQPTLDQRMLLRVVISFQFCTFVSLMQLMHTFKTSREGCD